ncbi:MAG: TGS domain-containing protein, partial [Stellaceae bacterium]
MGADKAADAGARLAGDDKPFPGRRRPLRLRGDDLDLIALPRGATAVDFAYAVHSEIGDTCVGAKINGRLVPLRSQLGNGDQVEIVTSKAQRPSPTWERFVVTGKARARIRRFIRTQQRAQYLDLGKAI